NNKFEFVSDSSYQVLGYTPEEMVGTSYSNYISEEDIPLAIERGTSVKEGFDLSLFENRYVHKNGSLVYLMWSVHYEQKDEVFYCLAKDMTHYKQLVKKVEENESLLLEAQKVAKMGSWNFDFKKDKLTWSDGLYTIFDINKELFLETHNSYIDFINPEDRDIVLQTSKNTQETGEPFNIVYRIKTPSGEERFVEEFGYSEKDSSGKIIRLFGTAHDITERKKNEALLQDSNNKYQYLFENSPLPLFLVDFETLQILDCNVQCLRLYGYTKDEFVQLTIKDIHTKEELPLLQKATENETVHGEILKRKTRHLKKNGEVMHVEITAHLLNYNNRRCSLVLINDITATIELEKKQKEYVEFIETTLENLPIGIAVNKINDGSATLMNKQFYETYGWPKQDLINVINFFEKVYPDVSYREQIMQQVGSDMSSKDPERMIWEGITITTQNGEERIINAKNIPIYDQNLMISTVVDVTERFTAQKNLQLSNERYHYATLATSDAIWDWDFVNNRIYRAEGFNTIFGFDMEELNSPDTNWENYVHPDDVAIARKSLNDTINGNENYWIHEYRLLKPNGQEAYVKDSAYLIRDENKKITRIIGALKDISQRNYYHNLEILERQVLEINALGSVPITEIISKYMLGIEKLHPGMLCSMLIRRGNQLFNLASPSLPAAYLDAVNGVTIGDNVGSCGTAAFTRKKVIVTDIPNDFRWANYKEVVAEYGLKACWSTPILNAEGEVLATFAAYYKEVKSPSTVEENTIERASYILQVILESYLKENALKESNLRYEYVTKATSDAIWDWDFENNKVYRAEGFRTIFGFDMEELNLINTKWENYIHPDDRELALKSIHDTINSTDIYWKHEYRIIIPNGKVAYVHDSAYIIRGEDNNIRRVIGAIQDITQRKNEEQQLKLFASVVTNTTDSVLITEAEPFDEPGPRILYVNEAFTKMTGYTAEEVIGKTPRILQGPKTDKAELKRLSKALRNWESCEVTVINYKKSGEEFWINFSVNPVADEKGWFTHWIAVERDVTIRKNEELQNELIADISTVYNEPLKLNETLDRTLRYIADFADFCFAEAWLTSTDKNSLNKISSHATTENSKLFIEETNSIDTFKYGEGFSGIVAKNKEITIWENLANLKQFSRRDAAIKYGLKAKLGIPLLYNNELIGVLTFGLNHEVIDTAKYYTLLKKLGDYLSPEIKRKQLELELNQMFNFAPDMIVTIGLDQYFKRVNPAACQLLGYTQEELCAEHYTYFVHPEDRENAKNEFSKLLETNSSSNFENRYITKSGKIKWLSWNAIYVPEDNNIYAVAKDITDKKELEHLLQKVNELARIGGWEVDLQNRTLFWSDITKEIIEVAPDYVPEIETAIGFYENDSTRTKISEYVRHVIDTGKSFAEEFQIVTAKGNNRWIRVTCEAEFVNGNCIRVYGSMQDIHERKNAEEELRVAIEKAQESDARFKAYTQQSPIAIYTTDIKGDCVYANQTWLEMADMQLEDALGKGWINALHPEDLEFVTENWYKSIESGGEWNYEYRFLNSNKDIIWVSGNAKKLFNEKNEHIGYLGSNADITKRKEAEIKLIESENYLRTILESEPECVKVLNSKGELLSMNPAGLAMIEADNEQQVLGQRMADLVDENYSAGFKQVSKEVFKGNCGSFEFEITGLKGTQRWLETHAVPLKDTTGKVVNLLGVTRDITERKKNEAALKQSAEKIRISKERLQKAQEIGKFGYWQQELHSDAIWASKEAMLICGLGTEEGELQRATVAACIIDLDKVREATAKLVEHGIEYDIDIRINPADGSPTRFISALAELENNENGEPVRIVGTLQDITERKKAEEEIKNTEERRKLIMNSALDAIICIDKAGMITFWNPQAEQIFGWSENEVMGKLLSAIIVPEKFRAMHSAGMDRYMETGKGQSLNKLLQLSAIKRDGTEFPIELTVLPIQQDGEEFFCAFIRDITERKFHEDQLLKLNEDLNKQKTELISSNKELEQFAYVASHDLQEPLRMVTSFLTLLEKKYNDVLDEKGLKYINFAVDGAKNMRQIILDILEFSRINEHQENYELIDLKDVIKDVNLLQGKLIKEKRAQIFFEELPKVYSIRHYLIQLFQNIISNALKYSKEDVPLQIIIKSKEYNDHYRISIKDNGIGIEDEYFEKIFIIFQRLHGKDKYQGNGMGLAIAKKIVDKLNGKIWVKSQLGIGSTFYINIPKK
ncbi:PAS domain S-box protein, partial [Flavobacterium sp.]|uniref:PAS domain S-box protein n=1 Tax=Flavobacterium sp. TaxID=239 RepID=UPI000EE2E06C